MYIFDFDIVHTTRINPQTADAQTRLATWKVHNSLSDDGFPVFLVSKKHGNTRYDDEEDKNTMDDFEYHVTKIFPSLLVVYALAYDEILANKTIFTVAEFLNV